jgi:hypothetical protein
VTSPANVPAHHQVVIRYQTGGKTGGTGQGGSGDIVVQSHIPDEDVELCLGANWVNALSTIPMGAQARRLMSGLQTLNQLSRSISGVAIGDPAMSALAYQGSDNPEMQLLLEFNSDGDGERDVVRPIINLVKMTVPSRISTGIIEFPGPSAADEFARFFSEFKGALNNSGSPVAQQVGGFLSSFTGNTDADGNSAGSSPQISVMVGNIMYFQSVVITSLSLKVSTKVDANLRPVHATAAVRFKRFTSPLREDIEKTFLVGAEGP